jgi:hypothetical protein
MNARAAVQPIIGVLAASPALLADAQAAIATAVAPVALASVAQPWAVSTYYAAEMGKDLWRQYLACDALMAPEHLGELKRVTGTLEVRWRGARGRAVNLDPGYLDLLRVVLASTKDAAHRVAIGTGLWAEATLHFVDGSFTPWPYTYPDYASRDACGFFNEVRERFRAARVSEGGGKLVWSPKAC